MTDNGSIKNSIRNCLTVLQYDPVLFEAISYNILTERIDIVKPMWWDKQTSTLTDTDLNYLMLYLADQREENPESNLHHSRQQQVPPCP